MKAPNIALPSRICPHCKKEIHSWRPSKFCSKQCSFLARRKPRRPCEVCGELCASPRARFCSYACMAKSPEHLARFDKLHSSECMAKSQRTMRGRPQVAASTAKAVSNKAAVRFKFRDPDGKIWEGRNISHFVREHAHLFDPPDARWRPAGKQRGLFYCTALSGLLQLHRHSIQTWKGWTAR